MIDMIKWFNKVNEAEGDYYEAVNKIEKEMKKELGENIEFFWSDGEVVGIGSEDRAMKLIHRRT